MDTANDDLVTSLKQLVISFYPYIKQAESFDHVQDAILHMEELDPNFHRYDFVKQLRRKIDAELSDVFNRSVDAPSCSSAGDNATSCSSSGAARQVGGGAGVGGASATADSEGGYTSLSDVESAVEKVVKSDQYIKLNSDLKKLINESIASLSEQSRNQAAKTAKGHLKDSHEPVFFSDESSLGDSSLNQSSYMFMNADQFRNIVDNMDKKQTLEKRREAILCLHQITINDAQSCNIWREMKLKIFDSLSDADDVISNTALTFIARGLSSNNTYTKEIYVTMVEYLVQQFKTANKSIIPKISEGLNIDLHVNCRLIKAFRLMNEFQINIAQYWIRYSERILDEIIDSTMSFLSSILTNGNAIYMSPMHYLSLIDPLALWQKNWMHAYYSRKHLVASFGKHKSLVTTALRVCFSQDYVYNSRANQKVFYTSSDLCLLHFIHCVSLIGRLIENKHGRTLFPLKINNHQEPVSVNKIVIHFVTLILKPNGNVANTKTDKFNVSSICFDILMKISLNDIIYDEIICSDDYINVLLAPLHNKSNGQLNDTMMIRIADLLSLVCDRVKGRRHIFKCTTTNKLSAAELIAEFVSCTLRGQPLFDYAASKRVLAEFIYVLRQVYSTCSGFESTNNFHIDRLLVTAFRQLEKDPKFIKQGNSSNNEIAFWESTLLNNLVSFAMTPKGLRLLTNQSRDLHTALATYIYTAHSRNQQVSKREQFGHGSVISAFLLTRHGISMICKTDYIKDLVTRIWGILEVIDDRPMLHPHIWLTLANNKLAVKALNQMVLLTCEYVSVSELFKDQTLQPVDKKFTFRDPPDNVMILFDRIVFINTDNKIQSLFNFELTHLFGLRLLNIIVCNIDSLLMLEVQYGIVEMMLQGQRDACIANNKQIIIDILTIEQNLILLRCHILGCERLLPPRLENVEDYRYPLFSKFPVPNEYIVKSVPVKPIIRYDSDAIVNLKNSSSLTTGQIVDHMTSLMVSNKEKFSTAMFNEIFDSLADFEDKLGYSTFCDTLIISKSTKKEVASTVELAINMVIRYGGHLGFLSDVSDNREKLKCLIKQSCQWFPDYLGFDWFTAVLFLLYSADVDMTLKRMAAISNSLTSYFIWPARQFQFSKVEPFPLILSVTCHNIDILLELEIPEVRAAFRLSGISIGHVCHQWIRQCFLNYLTFPEIVNYILICVCLGVDYQVYICVSILNHLKDKILENCQNQNLLIILKEDNIASYKFSNNLEYLRKLELKYRSLVLTDMYDSVKNIHS